MIMIQCYEHLRLTRFTNMLVICEFLTSLNELNLADVTLIR